MQRMLGLIHPQHVLELIKDDAVCRYLSAVALATLVLHCGMLFQRVINLRAERAAMLAQAQRIQPDRCPYARKIGPLARKIRLTSGLLVALGTLAAYLILIWVGYMLEYYSS